ncbi:MAG: nitronate monooxygenase, partial [Deltaproteobacteria bacterium]|nr:nitronate monooxygenase [Deltaproteobacteria bacterium]
MKDSEEPDLKNSMVLDDFRLSLRGKDYRPIMIGGMGVDISSSALALEAARLGAIGHISDAMAPYVVDRKFRTKFQHTKMSKYKTLQKLGQETLIQWDPEAVYKAQLLHIQSTMDAKRGDGAIFANVMEKLT